MQQPTPKSKFLNKAPTQSERQNFETVKQTTKQTKTQSNLDKLNLNNASEREILSIPGMEYYITASKIVKNKLGSAQVPNFGRLLVKIDSSASIQNKLAYES